MSHYTVAVITPSLNDVEHLLAPFQQNNLSDCPKEYLTFVDIEPEYKLRYETETAEYIELEKGELVSPDDPIFRKPIIGELISIQEVPTQLKRVQIPHNQVYASFDDFMVQFIGYRSKDEKTGTWGYWENSNAKWDWWEIGGRWSNMLLLRTGERVNAAKLKDIFFVEQDTCEGVTVEVEGMRIPAALAPNFQIGAVEASEEWDAVMAGKGFFNPAFYLKRYVDKRGFFRHFVSISTYAVVTPDGAWHASGEMGWFGIGSETPEAARDFSISYYDTFIKNANPEHYLVIVDCHI